MLTESKPQSARHVTAHMEKPSVSLLNVLTDAPLPSASDLHEDFVLAEPGQNFKALVLLKRLAA